MPSREVTPPLRQRRARIDFSTQPVYWNGGDAFRTRFLDALSVNFPEGERFFIDSVRAFETVVTDPALREDIRVFVRQEAEHGLVHDRFNETMRAQGVNVDRILKTLRGDARGAKQLFSAEMQLALTAAAEHMTATLAEGLLELTPEMIEGATPEMRALFLWHSVEEIEHKCVAFDVLEKTGAGYAERVFAMVAVTAYLHLRVGILMKHMLTVDGVLHQPGIVALGLLRMYGPRGYLTKLVPRYLAWFRPGFHPRQAEVPEAVHTWARAYEAVRDPLRATADAFSPLTQEAA